MRRQIPQPRYLGSRQTMKHIGVCPDTGKRKYGSKKQAKRAARANHPGEHMNAWQCQACGHYHLGHLPRTVLQGRVPRSILSVPSPRETL